MKEAQDFVRILINSQSLAAVMMRMGIAENDFPQCDKPFQHFVDQKLASIFRLVGVNIFSCQKDKRKLFNYILMSKGLINGLVRDQSDLVVANAVLGLRGLSLKEGAPASDIKLYANRYRLNYAAAQMRLIMLAMRDFAAQKGLRAMNGDVLSHIVPLVCGLQNHTDLLRIYHNAQRYITIEIPERIKMLKEDRRFSTLH